MGLQTLCYCIKNCIVHLPKGFPVNLVITLFCFQSRGALLPLVYYIPLFYLLYSKNAIKKHCTMKIATIYQEKIKCWHTTIDMVCITK